MYTKSLFFTLIVLALLTLSAHTLVLHKSSKYQAHMTKTRQLTHFMTNRVMSVFHLQQKKEQNAQKANSSQSAPFSTQDQWIVEILMQLLADQDLFTSFLSGSPLSKDGEQRLKDIFLKNNGFMNLIIAEMDKDTSMPDCAKKLKPEQKKKMLEISIQAMDLSEALTFVTGSLSEGQTDSKAQAKTQSLSDLQTDETGKIITAIKNEKTLGPNVAKCAEEIMSG